jgi:hypothetical protein
VDVFVAVAVGVSVAVAVAVAVGSGRKMPLARPMKKTLTSKNSAAIVMIMVFRVIFMFA